MSSAVVKMLGTPTSYIGLLRFESSFLLACTLGQGAAGDGSRSWVPAAHRRNLD